MDIVPVDREWVEIRVGRNHFAKVDKEDLPKVDGKVWGPTKGGKTTYATRRLQGTNSSIGMHRVIVDAPPGMEVDHVNGNGLDNRRHNLRLCTKSQNQGNRQKHRQSASKFKGVWWDKSKQKWRAAVRVNGRRIYGGLFLREEDAARRYDELAIEHFGRFARVNFP